jgi:hypothetical protein
MNSKAGLALSAIGIAAVLMLVLAPITANHQTFGYTYRYHGKLNYYHYFHGYGYKRCFVRNGHVFCLVK